MNEKILLIAAFTRETCYVKLSLGTVYTRQNSEAVHGERLVKRVKAYISSCALLLLTLKAKA
jgi:hypothetical protein